MKRSIVISLLTITILLCNAVSFASTGVVTTDTLRMRKDASVDASIVALLSMDNEVEILESKNGWYKVKAQIDSAEVIGYVSADYIKQKIEKENADKEEVKKEENDTDEKKAEEDTQDQENKIKVKTLSAGIKVYITPVINSIVLATLEEEKQIEVISEVNGWSYINTGDIKGWVRTENIVEKEKEKEKEASKTEQKNSSQKTGYISASSVNFRKEANASSSIISKFTKNTKVKVLSEKDGWAKIEHNGKVGYVSASYVSDKKLTTTSRSALSQKSKSTTSNSKTKVTTQSQTSSNASKSVDISKNTKETKNTNASNTKQQTVSKGKASGSEIVAYAKKYLGSKYVYGGNSPSGFDCSGFTSYIYKHFGYSLARSSSAQASNGKAVNRSNLQAGDIICFSRSSGSKKIGHVGIYIGGGQFIHAANSRKGVITSKVDGAGFYFVCARRII